MKRTLFVSGTGSLVLAVALLTSSVGGVGTAAADSRKKPTPTPTDTSPPPPPADLPGCWDAEQAHLFWHRDVVPGSTAKLNAGEIAAVIYITANNCPGEVYHFEVLDDLTGSQVLAAVDVTASDYNTVNLTRFLKLSPDGTIDTDVNDDYRTIRLRLKIYQAGVLMATAPTAGPGTPGGAEITDDDGGSGALNGYH